MAKHCNNKNPSALSNQKKNFRGHALHKCNKLICMIIRVFGVIDEFHWCYISVENLSLLQKGKNIVLEVNITMVWGYYRTQLGDRLKGKVFPSSSLVKTTNLVVTACVTHFWFVTYDLACISCGLNNISTVRRIRLSQENRPLIYHLMFSQVASVQSPVNT